MASPRSPHRDSTLALSLHLLRPVAPRLDAAGRCGEPAPRRAGQAAAVHRGAPTAQSGRGRKPTSTHFIRPFFRRRAAANRTPPSRQGSIRLAPLPPSLPLSLSLREEGRKEGEEISLFVSPCLPPPSLPFFLSVVSPLPPPSSSLLSPSPSPSPSHLSLSPSLLACLPACLPVSPLPPSTFPSDHPSPSLPRSLAPTLPRSLRPLLPPPSPSTPPLPLLPALPLALALPPSPTPSLPAYVLAPSLPACPPLSHPPSVRPSVRPSDGAQNRSWRPTKFVCTPTPYGGVR